MDQSKSRPNDPNRDVVAGFETSSLISSSCKRKQHTTLHITAGLLLKLSRVGLGQFLDGRPDVAGSGVGGPSRRHSFLWSKKISQ
jgi:hypothetical protein